MTDQMGLEETLLRNSPFRLNSILHICSLVFATIISLLFTINMLRGRKIYWKRPFYKLLVQLVAANFLATAASALLPLYAEIPVLQKFLEVLADQLVRKFLMVIAVQRLAVFVKPQLSEHIFSRRRTKWVILICWIVSICLSAFLAGCGCDYFFSKRTEHFEFSCTALSVPGAVLVNDNLLFEKTTYPLIMLVCYMYIFINKTRGGQSVRVDFGEKDILHQAMSMSLIMQISPMAKIVLLTCQYSPGFVSRVPVLISSVDLLIQTSALFYLLLISKDLRRFIRIRFSTRLTRLQRTPPSRLQSASI